MSAGSKPRLQDCGPFASPCDVECHPQPTATLCDEVEVESDDVPSENEIGIVFGEPCEQA